MMSCFELPIENESHSDQLEIEQNIHFEVTDMNSFSLIYSRYQKPILKYVSKSIKSPHTAEEITQDIFVKIYQSRHAYDPTYNASAWIWTIVRNTVYDHFRKTKTSAIEIAGNSDPQNPSWEPTSHDTAESLILEEMDKQKLVKLMASLSANQKKAIFLRIVKKFSYQEISKSMNLSLSAVKSLINRGKSTLTKLHDKMQQLELNPEANSG